MAKIDITQYVTTVSQKLEHRRYVVHVNFLNEEVFNSYIKNGFKPEEWEIKNENQVLINDIHYKEYFDPKPKMKVENGYITSINFGKPIGLKFGEYIFSGEELGELFHSLIEERKNKK